MLCCASPELSLALVPTPQPHRAEDVVHATYGLSSARGSSLQGAWRRETTALAPVALGIRWGLHSSILQSSQLPWRESGLGGSTLTFTEEETEGLGK